MTAEIGLTGGTGFIGGHFLAPLLAPSGTEGVGGLAVRMLHRRSDDARSGIRSIQGSLEQEDALGRLVDGVDAVLHLAGSVKARSRDDFARANVDATARLARLAERHGVGRFILVSSLAATVPEASNYAWSKAEGEKAAAAELRNCRLDIVRPPAIYGPGDRMTLPIFKQIAAGVLLVPKGGMQRFSLLHVEDLAGLLHAMLRESPDMPVVEPDDGHADGHGWKDMAQAGEAIAQVGERFFVWAVGGEQARQCVTALGLALVGGQGSQEGSFSIGAENGRYLPHRYPQRPQHLNSQLHINH